MSVVTLPLPRRRAKPRRAQEIIEAAARVFAERGFHGATTQDIADVLGIRQASLYYYFSSKEDALELVCARGAEGFLEAAAVIAAGSQSPTEKLRALIHAHLAPLLDRPDFVRVFLNERRHLPPASRRRIGQTIRAYEKVIEEVIKAGMQSGEFRADLDPRLVTYGMLGMVKSVVGWFDKPPTVTIECIVEEFFRLLVRGLSSDKGGRGPTSRRRRSPIDL
ncbi:MAG TPA: TetR/AcrR family transcriptional regulator [Xanthobacteraceae bacterium]|nr:TetR/AcrR family transcriptional regulator [Xanthobacteraceae bacterium]